MYDISGYIRGGKPSNEVQYDTVILIPSVIGALASIGRSTRITLCSPSSRVIHGFLAIMRHYRQVLRRLLQPLIVL